MVDIFIKLLTRMEDSKLTLQEKLDALFDRVEEPFWCPRINKKYRFELADAPSVVRSALGKSSSDFTPNLKTLPVNLPAEELRDKLQAACQIRRNCAFSVFIPEHQELAARLVSTLCGIKEPEDFVSAAVYCHDSLEINPSFYTYAVMVAAAHHPKLKNLRLKQLTEISPTSFVETAGLESEIKHKYFKKLGKGENYEAEMIDIEVQKLVTGSPLNPEHKLWYFREDVLMNLHHWHWHVIYPTFVPEIKDRRGELFYYMHQQVIARYNFERLCHNMSRVKSLSDFNEPIEEGYFSKLTTVNATRRFPGRNSGHKLSDVERRERGNPGFVYQLSDLVMWRDRLLGSISRGTQGIVKMPDGSTETLDIDTLGNMVEASRLSPNPNYYGNLHNMGHLAIASCHDPRGLHNEDLGVMGTTTAAFRDPVFFRWHAFINDMFTKHKDRLQPYQYSELAYDGIEIQSVEVTTLSSPDHKNVLHTTWQNQTMAINNGLDFVRPTGNNQDVRVRVKYMALQNLEFEISIKVLNNSVSERLGTVRVFLAPKYNDLGHEWVFNEHKNFFIELDRQVVTLSEGCQTIVLNSLSSAVTLKIPEDGEVSSDAYCSCGWPQNLLLPMGNVQGMKCQLYVMISNYDDDKVIDASNSDDSCTTCKMSPAYCGLRDQKYPDKRAMGFPFDRLVSSPEAPQKPHVTAASFADKYTNMHLTEVEIKFTDNSAQLQSKE